MRGWLGFKLPIVVAHGEGRAVFADPRGAEQGLVSIRYLTSITAAGPRIRSPQNPNGAARYHTGLTVPMTG
ncbi:MAG: phosphoribosylformylglycinamidine synthase subunit PurQ [Gammaproteobacteria bacterium]